MSVTKLTDFCKVKRIPQGMCNHDRFCFLRKCLFQHFHIYIIRRNCDIHKNRYGTILENRCCRGRKAAGNRDYLIPSADSSVPQFLCRQCHESNQVCRRTAVYQMGIFYPNPLSKFFLKPFGKPPRCQPEVQHGIRQGAHFLFIKHPCRIGNPISPVIRLFLFLKLMIILCD